MGALEFCKQHKLKLAEDKSLLENPISVQNYLIENRYVTKMSVHYSRSWLGGFTSRGYAVEILTLDAEDLAYLYEKYKIKASEELEEGLIKFKEEHANI